MDVHDNSIDQLDERQRLSTTPQLQLHDNMNLLRPALTLQTSLIPDSVVGEGGLLDSEMELPLQTIKTISPRPMHSPQRNGSSTSHRSPRTSPASDNGTSVPPTTYTSPDLGYLSSTSLSTFGPSVTKRLKRKRSVAMVRCRMLAGCQAYVLRQSGKAPSRSRKAIVWTGPEGMHEFDSVLNDRQVWLSSCERYGLTKELAECMQAKSVARNCKRLRASCSNRQSTSALQSRSRMHHAYAYEMLKVKSLVRIRTSRTPIA